MDQQPTVPHRFHGDDGTFGSFLTRSDSAAERPNLGQAADDAFCYRPTYSYPNLAPHTANLLDD